MDFELRQAREKLEREQRERVQRAKAKAERERRAKAEAARRRDALEASHRERRLDAARAQEEADQKMEEAMQIGKGISFSRMFEALRYDGPAVLGIRSSYHHLHLRSCLMKELWIKVPCTSSCQRLGTMFQVPLRNKVPKRQPVAVFLNLPHGKALQNSRRMFGTIFSRVIAQMYL